MPSTMSYNMHTAKITISVWFCLHGASTCTPYTATCYANALCCNGVMAGAGAVAGARGKDTCTANSQLAS